MSKFSDPPNMAAFQKHRAAAIATLVKGVSSLLEVAGVKVVKGTGRFVGRTRICVEIGEESVRYFDFKDVVIATGTRKIDVEGAVDPTAALEWDFLPASLDVFGDDYIALELAVAYSRLGSKVTLAAAGDCLLPSFDQDLSAAALRGARDAGVKLELSSNASAVGSTAERAIASGERRPNLDDLDLHAAGLKMTGGRLAVDAQLRLDRHVFAIGDITEGPQLAHRTMMQGRIAGDVLGGKAAAFDSKAIPFAIFAEQEIAAVGMTEAEASSAGIDVAIGRFPLAALGRAVIDSSTSGFAKLIFAKHGGALLGAHLAGPRSTELIAEMTLGIEMGATAEDLALTSHSHPTYAEAVMEAAEVSLGRPINTRPAKR